MTRTEFEALAADYYDASESETLSHETIAEAIEFCLDGWATPGCDMVALIRERAPIEVVAHRQAKVTDDWLDGTALHVLEAAAESWGEEYGDPDSGHEFDQKDYDRALPGMAAVIRAFLVIHGPSVWSCDRIGAYTYSAEEVEAMMRAANPEWFELTQGPVP